MAELVKTEHEETEERLQEKEQRIAELIARHTREEYAGVLQDAAWDIFYQISPLREGLYNWYPFKAESEILELSDGYGAITELLCRKGKQVTVVEESSCRAKCMFKRFEDYQNLTIVSGKLQMLPAGKQYDYIVVEKAINTKAELSGILQETIPFLREEGRLLFVCENRFGMKYWCGVPDPVKNRPFSGIREVGMDGLLTRHDLMTVLEQCSQIAGWHLYYPFPDHRLPQAIYTDDYLPKASVRDRVIPYYPAEQRNSLVCLENEICDGLIANGVFHIFSNSFLVECSKTAFEPEVLFAALSTDRGAEHGFATVITRQNTVQKRILYAEGRKSLGLIYENQKELERHGISCVSQSLKGDGIEMPYVREPSLIEYLKYAFLNEKEKVEEIFDGLYQAILMSSEHVSYEKCMLKEKGLTALNAGVILRKAYIDMIPYNCFYKDGQFMFYDQEFVKEYYPAKYVLFRALRYTYIYIPEAEEIIPLHYFKEKYMLNHAWQAFEREEGRFVEDNRNYELLSAFYKWAGVSKADVDANVRRLQREDSLEKGEEINGNAAEDTKEVVSFQKKKYDLSKYANDKKLEEIKGVQLKILQEFMRVCEENGLSYCAFYGTLLGAVRHKGYIPWDDDLDMAMPRADYDRLLEIAPASFSAPYFLQTPENDAGCFYGGYSKLRDGSTAGLEERNRNHNCNQGIWIDIFPLDYVLKDGKEKEKQLRKIRFYQRLLMKKAYPEKRMLWELKEEKENLYLSLGKLFSRKFLCDKLYDAIVNYGGELSDRVAIMTRYQADRKYSEYREQDLEFVIEEKFEELRLPIPVGFEECLKVDYGSSYLIFPEESERRPHHDAFFDVKKSYLDYLTECGQGE